MAILLYLGFSTQSIQYRIKECSNLASTTSYHCHQKLAALPSESQFLIYKKIKNYLSTINTPIVINH